MAITSHPVKLNIMSKLIVNKKKKHYKKIFKLHCYGPIRTMHSSVEHTMCFIFQN